MLFLQGHWKITPDSRNLTAITVDFSGDSADAAFMTLITLFALNPSLDMNSSQGNEVTDFLVLLCMSPDGGSSGEFEGLHYASETTGDGLRLEITPVP